MATRRLLIYSTRSSSTSSIFTSPEYSWREIEIESEREIEIESEREIEIESEREIEREGEGEGQIDRESGACG